MKRLKKRYPWKLTLKDTNDFIVSSNRWVLAVFFLLTAVISFLMQGLNDFEWSYVTQRQLWTKIGIVVGASLINLSLFLIFVLWVKAERTSARSAWKSWRIILTSFLTLFLPVLVYSVRGVVLTLLGLFLLVVPGVYFFFKYDLVVFCLVAEGWIDEVPPVQRAEQIIGAYGLTLWVPVALRLFSIFFSTLLELLMTWNGTELGLPGKSVLAVSDSVVTLWINIYLILAVIRLVHQIEPFQEKLKHLSK